MVRAVRPAKSYLRSRALPTAAISRLLSDRGESVSTFVMTGLPMSLLGLSLLFSFQSLRAPCLSAEPYRRKDLLGATKNPLGEWASGVFPVHREATLSRRLGCQIASGHRKRIIAPRPDLSKASRQLYALSLSIFEPTQAPRLSAER